jgi:uroporphyrinogen-III synthase
VSIYLLSESVYEGAENLPIIKSHYKQNNLDLSAFDALIFSSKNAVMAIEEINSAWKNIPSYAIGVPTASLIESLGGHVAYISKSSYGDKFAKELIPLLRNKRVLFLRAKKISSDIENILTCSQIDLTSHVVYETTCSSDIPLHAIEKNSIIIFTSPSAVECFLKKYAWDNSFRAVCIGERTSGALPSHILPIVSETQTIEACISLAKTLIKQD